MSHLEETTMGIRAVWLKVFPQSSCSVQKACLSSNVFYINCYLYLPKEFPNGISQNDPLNYMFEYDAYTETYREIYCSISCKPIPGTFYAMHSYPLRKKTIKNINEVKLLQRFQEIKAHCILHAHELFDSAIPPNKLGIAQL